MSDRRLALVVAIDQYDHPRLTELAAPAADAQALAGVLGDEALGGFEVEVLRNPTSWALSRRIEQMLAGRHTSDLVLLHFSGHGIKDDAGELYLAATDTQPDLLGSTAVDAAWVNRVMQRSRAQSVVLLLDCCYGGAFERGVIRRAAGDIDVGDQFRPGRLDEGRGRVVITASTAMEYAFEGAELAEGAAVEPSVFTGALVDGIRSGDADRDQDGHVSLSELYDFVFEQVREQSPHQTPSKWEFGLRGDLVVARNPNRRVRAATLPRELMDLVRHPVPAARLAAVRELATVAAGDDLMRAAAARITLQEMVDDDSRMVSAEAGGVLDRTRVRLATDTLNIGTVSPGGPPVTIEVAVTGSPLALASTVSVQNPLRARLDGATLRVTWPPGEPGDLAATVTLEGPAGVAELVVTGKVAEPQPVPPAAPAATRPAQALPASSPVAAGGNAPAPQMSPARLKRILIGSFLVLVLLTATAVTLIVSDSRRQERQDAADSSPSPTGGASVLPGGARDQAALVAMLPASLRSECTAEKPSDGSTAAAFCGDGLFALWSSVANMEKEVNSSLGDSGNCASAPALHEYRTGAFPAVGRTGKLVCQRIPDSKAGESFYAVTWGVDDLLLSGTFFSSSGKNPADYPQTYSTALAVLTQLP